MAKTSWFGGRKNFQLGPANLYVKRVDAGSWQDNTGWLSLERTESVTWKGEQEKADLVSSQTGTKPANKVEVGFEASVEAGLGEAIVEVIEKVMQGVIVRRDTAGDVIQVLRGTNIGRRDTDDLLWMKVVRLTGGAESTDPLDTVYMLVCPNTESGEWTFDAATQQFPSCMFKGYPASSDYVEDEDDQVYATNADGQLVACHYWTDEVV